MTAKERLKHAEVYAKAVTVGTHISDTHYSDIRKSNMDSAIRWQLGRFGLCMSKLATGGWSIERLPPGEEITAVACFNCRQEAFTCQCDA